MVAWIALGISLASLGWNVFVWWKGRRTDVFVELSPLTGITSLVGRAAAIHVINRSGHSVWPNHIGMELSDGRKLYLKAHAIPRLMSVLTEIPARHGELAILNPDDMTYLGFDPTKPVKLWVELSTREMFWSKPVVLSEPDADSSIGKF